MSVIRKRVTLTAGGTPEFIGNLMAFRLPDGVPKDAVVVDVEFRAEERYLTSAPGLITHSQVTFTLEWAS